MPSPTLAFLLTSVLVVGCAGSVCRAPVGDPALIPSTVAATHAFIGEPVAWEGILVERHHMADTTELEVVAYPLDNCGRPSTEFAQTGRFIIVYPGYLETADLPSGHLVSASGRITGIRKGQLGARAYDLPLLESHRIQGWPVGRSGSGYSRTWMGIGVGGYDRNLFGGIGVLF